MPNTRRNSLCVACLATMLLLASVPLWAVGRTTPVEVLNTPLVGIDPNSSTVKAVQTEPWYVEFLSTPNFNVANSPTVKIDGTTNTVKATQSGTWNVGVSTMPTVNVNTHAVTQSGTWNVGINNTPSVAQSGTWNVGISSTANTVKAPPQTQMIQLWTEGHDLAPGAHLYSQHINTAGYRKMHVVLVGNMVGETSRAALLAEMGDGTVTELGKARWLSPTPGFVQGGDFVVRAPYLIFSCDVIYDLYEIRVDNDHSNVTITIFGNSYVYLTN